MSGGSEGNGVKEQGGGGWPDGLTIRWKGCPGCGNKDSLFDEVTAGEGAVKPPGTTKLFTLPMPYQTLLQDKVITAFLDICGKCGAVYCRGILKGPVESRVVPGRN